MSAYNEFRYKGKLVSKKQYNRRKQISEIGKKNKKLCKTELKVSKQNSSPTENVDSNLSAGDTTNIANDIQPVSMSEHESVQDAKTNVENDKSLENIATEDDLSEFRTMEGRRIVEFAVLGSQLWCVSCKEALSLEYIENEIRRGLGSILSVRCHKCLILNIVTTGKQHESSDGRAKRFDVNAKMVLGMLCAGMGWTHLNKILGCLNIPTIGFSTYKRYKDEIGPLIEQRAKENCAKVAGLERELTIQDVAGIEKILPGMQAGRFDEGFYRTRKIGRCKTSQISSSQEASTATADLQKEITD